MEAATTLEEMVAGNLVIRPSQFIVHAGDTPLVLTVREFDLLVAFARSEGIVLTREEIYSAVWQQPFRRYERSVDVYVAKLRQKLEEASPDWQFIHTHFGFGYRFEPSRLR